MRRAGRKRGISALFREHVVRCAWWVAFAALAGMASSPAAAEAVSLSESLCGKQVVALGELPSHGEALAFQFKADLVQALVERCGFEAVLFEAPIYGFLGFSDAVRSGRAEQAQLDNAIGRFWRTQELAEWRQWLFGTAVGRRRLYVGGLDDQVSDTSDYAGQALPALIAGQLERADRLHCEVAVRRNLGWDYSNAHAYDADERELLSSCASRAVAAGGALAPEAMRMLVSLSSYYERSAVRIPRSTRDEAMYQNVVWHMGRLPPGAKVVIWTANVHAARRPGSGPFVPMGHFLAQRFGGDYAAIGGTALRGWSRMAGGPTIELEAAPEQALEAQAVQTKGAVVLVDAERLRKIGPVASRLTGSFVEADWSQYFDAVYVVRDERAPTPQW